MENRPVDPGQHPGESPTYILHKVDPGQHPGKSPTYILHKDKTENTRGRYFV